MLLFFLHLLHLQSCAKVSSRIKRGGATAHDSVCFQTFSKGQFCSCLTHDTTHSAPCLFYSLAEAILKASIHLIQLCCVQGPLLFPATTSFPCCYFWTPAHMKYTIVCLLTGDLELILNSLTRHQRNVMMSRLNLSLLHFCSVALWVLTSCP